ncbi:MAG: histone deacetylase [Planctomycetes bacterium]|nr:histone deacetylase [Planctomycetota bacterium]
MTLLYYDPRFLEHDTGRGHPERALRLRQIIERLESSGLAMDCRRPTWQPVSRTRLELVHEPGHIDRVAALAARGGGHLDPDTVVSPASYDVALLAAGAACDAVDRVLAGEDKTALCIVRPPGHHALPERAMGFCLFNNVAIAARIAIDEHELDRVLIVDWDVHHGNGTQDIFYADGRVGFFSAHRWPFYPGTGAADETGIGEGLGTTRNLPITLGTSRETYLELFRRELEDFASRMRPQLVLISAGFDSHRADPLGSFLLETEDFAVLTRNILNVAAVHAEGRVVSMLEGGYNPTLLADCVETHLRELM